MRLVKSNTRSSFAQWIVIAILPACAFVTVAVDKQSRLLVRYENEHLAEQLGARTCAIKDYYRNVDLSGICAAPEPDETVAVSNGAASAPGDPRVCKYPAARLASQSDIYPSSLFAPARWTDADRSGLFERFEWLRDDANDEAGDESAATDDEAGDEAREASAWTGDRRIWVRAGGDDSVGGTPGADAPTESYWTSLAWLKPIYSESVIGTRYLDTTAVAAQRARASEWSWFPTGGGSVFAASSLACGTDVVIASSSPLRIGRALLDPWVVGLGAALALALFFWTRYGVRRIFFGEIEDPVPQDLSQFEHTLAGTPAPIRRI